METENNDFDAKITPIHFRVSYLAGWNDCPKRGATGVLRNELQAMGYELNTRSNNVSGAIGTASHAGIKAYLEGLKTETAVVSKAVDAGILNFQEQSAEGLEFDATSPDGNAAEIQIKAIVYTYVFAITDGWDALPQDIVLEKRLEATITPTVIGGIQYQFTLSGQPDIVIGGTVIRDIKTGKSAEHYHAQLGGYSLLCKAMGETVPETCVVDHIQRMKPSKQEPKRWCGEAKSYEYPAALCETEARAVFSSASYQIARFLSSGDIGIFPCNISSMLCSNKYCSAYGTDFCPVSQTLKAKI